MLCIFKKGNLFVKYLNSVEEIFKITTNLQKKYNFLNLEVIGKSLCGRDILGLQFGSTKNMVLLACTFHGMEWLTSLVILRFLDTLCGYICNKAHICGIDISKHLEKRGVYIVPCVNPDGVEISLNGSGTAGKYQGIIEKIDEGNTFNWQSNARGVDINHNFDADWAKLHMLEKLNNISGPSKTRYGGKYPESEPETKAITGLCRKNNFDYAVAFHSQGEEIYWQYGKDDIKNSEKLANIFALSSGYALSRPEGLACGGGFKDWFIAELHKPAFTIEVGKGKNPLSILDIDSVYEKILNMLFMMVLI